MNIISNKTIEFYNAFKIIYNVNNEHYKKNGFPLIVHGAMLYLLCFSLELSFKSILELCNKKFKSIHNLIDLKKEVDQSIHREEKFTNLAEIEIDLLLKTGTEIIIWGKYGNPADKQIVKANNLLGEYFLDENKSLVNSNRAFPGYNIPNFVEKVDSITNHYFELSEKYFEKYKNSFLESEKNLQ